MKRKLVDGEADDTLEDLPILGNGNANNLTGVKISDNEDVIVSNAAEQGTESVLVNQKKLKIEGTQEPVLEALDDEIIENYLAPSDELVIEVDTAVKDEETLAEEGGKKKFKLSVGNLSKYTTKKELMKLMALLEIDIIGVKCIPKSTTSIIILNSQASLESAVKKLKNYSYKSATLYTSPVREKNFKSRDKVESRDLSSIDPDHAIQAQVTPLYNLPYAEQLASKDSDIAILFTKLKVNLRKYLPKKSFNRKIYLINDNVAETLATLNSMERAAVQLHYLDKDYDFDIKPIIPSPMINNYRTKCEFTFGKDLSGKTALGFLLGLFKDGITTVINPQECLHISIKAKTIANILQQYAIDSQYSVYDRVTKEGFFRLALVRTLASTEVMIMIQVNPQSILPFDLDLEIAKFKDYVLRECALNSINLVSLYYQQSSDLFNGVKDDMPITLLSGREYVIERALGLQFMISPFSFFQVNPWATEVLYSKIRDFCLLSLGLGAKNAVVAQSAESILTIDAPANGNNSTADETIDPVNSTDTCVKDISTTKADIIEQPLSAPGVIILDLCCGTGTIGQSLAPYVKKVIGIDMVASAITDAIANAKLNNLNNVTYHLGTLEQKIHGVLNYGNIGVNDIVIAILDPPRAGIHSSVIRVIRSTPQIKTIVFIACDLNQSLDNLQGFMRPSSGKFKGLPFRVDEVGSVDMFPHSKGCEVMVQLQRMDESMLHFDCDISASKHEEIACSDVVDVNITDDKLQT